MTWETVTLGSLAEFRNGINFSNGNFGHGIKVIGVADFQNYLFPKYEFLDQINPLGVVRQDDLLKENDILFVRSNGNRNFIGRSLFIKNLQEDVTHSGFTIRLRFLSSNADAAFFAQLFRADYIRRELSHSGSGTNISNLSQETLRKVKVPLPPLAEQRKIAAILSTWDEAIALTERLIAALQERKKGLMQRLLTGEIRFPGYSEPWQIIRIGELLKEVKRPVEWDDDSIYNLISIRRRSGGLFLRENLKGSEIATKKMNVAFTDDFLISKMQIVHGASGLTTAEFNGKHISGSYIALVVRNPRVLDIRFFDWVSRTPYFYNLTYLSSYGVHIEKMTFILNNFLSRSIHIPGCIEEQIKIVETLEVASQEIKLYEKKLAALQRQKKGLMQRLLTGEVSVKL
jgi:type I restriction enzyme, S subunit